MKSQIPTEREFLSEIADNARAGRQLAKELKRVDLGVLREKLGITQQVLADLLGVHFTYISRMENYGRRGRSVKPSLELLIRFDELITKMEQRGNGPTNR